MIAISSSGFRRDAAGDATPRATAMRASSITETTTVRFMHGFREASSTSRF
ncbi:hypothetical protein [Novosphingobium sp.]|uniref:hypothetical protein n=1 Tax=Novosphingobium sp. TaxID=1874826 RepID=UPI0031E08479